MFHTHVGTRADHGPASLSRPDPEVVVKAPRRQFSAEYKRRILQEADTCMPRGEVGALLHREGLHSSHLNTWRPLLSRVAATVIYPIAICPNQSEDVALTSSSVFAVLIARLCN